MTDRRFAIIGENVHATRVLLRKGRHVVALPGGGEAIAFRDAAGADRMIRIPEWASATSEYVEGRVKHVGIAIREAMGGQGGPAEDALAYLRSLVDRQVAAGAAYLDLNVDEISIQLEDQRAAMAWLVRTVQSWTDVPVSIDSSNTEILAEGLGAARHGSRPMLNSASLERRDALSLAREVGGPVIVTAAGENGMPADAAERVANASRMVEAALSLGIPLEAVFVDPLIFPISVDGAYGPHALDAIRAIRERFGPAVHVTGGFSNVSFGMPARRLLNDVFLGLVIEAGADSGIIDPTATHPDRSGALDGASRPVELARAVLLGTDIGCRAFLRAWRAGELSAA